MIATVAAYLICWIVLRRGYRQIMQGYCESILDEINQMNGFIEKGFVWRHPSVQWVLGSMVEVFRRTKTDSIQVPDVFTGLHQEQWRKVMDLLGEASEHTKAGRKEEALASLAAAKMHVEAFQLALGK